MSSLRQRCTVACARSTFCQRTVPCSSRSSRSRHSRASTSSRGPSPVNTRVRSSPNGRASSSGFASRLPSAARRCSTTRSARDSEPAPTASTRSDTMNSASRALRAHERLRQQLVTHLLLELALRAPPGSSCIRARYSSSRASSASFNAPAGNTRTWLRRRMRSVPATRRAKSSGCVATGGSNPELRST